MNEVDTIIGFKGTVVDGLILHPDNEHLIFPLGCTVRGLRGSNAVQETDKLKSAHKCRQQPVEVAWGRKGLFASPLFRATYA